MYNGLQIEVMQTSERAQKIRRVIRKSVRIKYKCSLLGHFFFQIVNEDERDREKTITNFELKSTTAHAFTYDCEFSMGKNMDLI